MSLIVLEHGMLSFGAQRILDDASLRIGEKERIGLVGPNGAGKSSLLKVLMGELPLDGGSLQHARNLAIGYLPQDVQELGGGTVLGSVLETVPGRNRIRSRLDEAEAALAASTDPEEQLRLAERLGELADELEHFETWFSEGRARTILLGLGFRAGELDRPLGELSGGWKMRCALAGLLFQQPDVLFLDEPTNHLDLPSVLWLDRFLDGMRSAVLLISHDRAFLDRHVERVISFEPDGLKSYTGNYQAYLAQRALEEEVRTRSLENRERVLQRNERFIERFRAKATKARQAQARARRVKRMLAELDAERPVAPRRTLSFHFPPLPRSGRDVLLLEDVHKSFGPLTLFDGLTRGVYAGDRIVIVGRNGAGKTTLLRMMAGDLAPDRGTVRRGTGVRIGYYAQHMSDQLDLRRTVVEEVRAASPSASESFVRGVCGAFLFSGDDVDKVVGVLSGGERARVQLARLLVNPGNLLLMDEPTNHLDVEAADALAEALSSYDGTLVFVSHDLGFVNRLATKVWDIEGGELLEYPGRLDEYLAARERREREKEPERPAGPAAAAKPAAAPPGRPVALSSDTPPASGRPAGVAPAQPPPSPPPPPPSPSLVRPTPPASRAVFRRPAAAATALVAAPAPAAPSPPQPASHAASAAAAPAIPCPPAAGPARKRRHGRGGDEQARAARRAAERERLQARIDGLVAEKAALEAQLADPEVYRDTARFDSLLRRFQEATAKEAELRARLG